MRCNRDWFQLDISLGFWHQAQACRPSHMPRVLQFVHRSPRNANAIYHTKVRVKEESCAQGSGLHDNYDEWGDQD